MSLCTCRGFFLFIHHLLGKEVTDALNANLQVRTSALREKGVTPTLGIIRVGANPSYEKGAVKRRRAGGRGGQEV